MQNQSHVRRPLLASMVRSYALFLLMPCIFLCGFYLWLTHGYFLEEHEHLKREMLEQHSTDISQNFQECEEAYMHVQTSHNFLRYLNGRYRTDVNQLVLYTTEFKSMFVNAKAESRFVESIHVYPLTEGLLKYNDYIRDINTLGDYNLSKQTVYGFWRYDEPSDRLIYRRALRDVAGMHELALIEIICLPELLTSRLSLFGETLEQTVHIFDSENNLHYQIRENRIIAADAPKDVSMQRNIPGTCFDVCISSSYAAPSPFSEQNVLTLSALAAIILLGLLSLAFFIPVARLTQRITAFSQHISSAPSDRTPRPYQDGQEDEFALLVDSFNSMLNENRMLVNQIELGKLQRSEMAYKMLQAQIDPHFVYNVLENIHMMAEMHNEEQISRMVVSLGQLLRYTFCVNVGEQVTLAAELDLVEQYLKLQKMRLNNRLEYRLSAPDSLDGLNIPQFTIQPLAENAIRHGLKGESSSIFMDISVSIDSDWLTIRASDNGASPDDSRRRRINEALKRGGSLSSLSSGTGVGLDSINIRMRYLYPETFSMELHEPEEGTGLVVLLRWYLKEKHDGRMEEDNP